MRKIFIRIFLILIFIFSLFYINCPTENASSNDKKETVLFPKRLGGSDYDRGYSVITDSNNRIIVTGYVCENADLNGDGDSNDGGAESGGSCYGIYDIFISLFNSSGTHQWSKRLGGTNTDYGNSVTDSNNRIIIIGNVTGNADLNGDRDSTDGGAEDSTGYGDTDIIISVFDSSGNYQWSKRLGGSDYDTGSSVITDSNSNIIVTGTVTGDADLNGDGDSTDGGAENGGSCYGDSDIFISVFDSSGNYQWSKRLGGSDYDAGSSVITDSNNRIIVTGTVTGNIDLNGDTLISAFGSETAGAIHSNSDIFISVFNSSGTHQWSKRLGGSYYDNGYSVTVDSNNNIIVTGTILSDADLNGDYDTLDGDGEDSTGYGDSDIFISVFNSSGTHQWSKRLGGTSEDYGYSVTTDSNNRVIVTGYLRNNADLNGDGDSTDGDAEDSTGYNMTDIFISVFDSSGSNKWSKRLGGTGDDCGSSVITDSNNRVIVTGSVTGNADLNGDGDSADGGAEDSTGYAYRDIFISVFTD